MIAVLALLLVAAGPAWAHSPEPPFLSDVGIDQRHGARLPADVLVRTAAGEARRLKEYLGGAPIVLTFNDYNCGTLCPLMLEDLARTVNALGLHPRDWRLVAVGLDPLDTVDDARAERERFVARLRDPDAPASVAFLTADRGALAQLTDTVGLRYVYDGRQDQFVHPAALVVLTPDGRVARYLFGVEHAPRDLRLALVEASAGVVGTPLDAFLLYCFRYDPELGRYSATVLTAVRAAGAVTLTGLAALLVSLWWQERRRDGRARNA